MWIIFLSFRLTSLSVKEHHLAMKTGREQLISWLDRQGLNQTEFAAMLRISKPVMCHYVRGRRRPTLPIAVRIYDITGIPVASWVPNGRGTSDRRRKQGVATPAISGV